MQASFPPASCLVSESIAAIKGSFKARLYPRKFQALATRSRCEYQDGYLNGQSRAYGRLCQRTHSSDVRHGQSKSSCTYNLARYSTSPGKNIKKENSNSSDPVAQQGARSDQESSVSTLEPEPPLGQRVRKLMRHVAHPVAIVTSISPVQTIDVGATISSFNTVSLEPDTVVSIHLRLPSSTFEAISDSQIFNLHIMREGPESASLAALFTKGNGEAGFRLLERDTQYIAGQLGGVQAKAPFLQSLRDKPSDAIILSMLECEYMSSLTVKVGDVAVVFGKVKSIHPYGDLSIPTPGNRSLVYVDGTYSRVTKHHESFDAQIDQLKDITSTFFVIQEGIARVIKDVTSELSQDLQNPALQPVNDKLRRLKHSLKSSEIFYEEMIQPFLSNYGLGIEASPQVVSNTAKRSSKGSVSGPMTSRRGFSTFRANFQDIYAGHPPISGTGRQIGGSSAVHEEEVAPGLKG